MTLSVRQALASIIKTSAGVQSAVCRALIVHSAMSVSRSQGAGAVCRLVNLRAVVHQAQAQAAVVHQAQAQAAVVHQAQAQAAVGHQAQAVELTCLLREVQP